MADGAGSTSAASVGRASGRTAIRVRTASPRRPSSATTAARPMRIKPPVNALTPATMSVVPRVNSLIGMPNPMAAMPTAAITIPNKDNIIDMLTPRSAILGSGHDAMVTKEFWPRSAPIAITNVALPRPNPILINAGHDALTLATSALDDARHHAPCKRIQACRQDAARQARPAVAGGWRAGVARSKRRFDPLPGRPLRPNELTRNRGWHASVTHRPPPASPDRLII
jgi:hypothetical protein